ncbi:MAG: FTR1 family iron permease [Acidiferrobacterales bacterium]
MFAAAVIVFREVLEAALIISIVLGASRGVAARGRWVAVGVAAGIAGACTVAVFADVIARSFSNAGQPLLNAGILLAAVLTLSWHNIWMASHGRELATQVKALGHDVQTGNKPLTALMVITLTAVMREGSEIVLFLWAIAAGGASRLGMLGGSVIGLMAGSLVGVMLYRGLLFIPLRHFFSITSWLILLLTAGLAAEAAGFLNQAGLLPALGQGLWNSSAVLSQESAPGQLLHILAGYTARPSGIQLVFYFTTLLGVLTLMRVVGRSARDARPRVAQKAQTGAQPPR